MYFLNKLANHTRCGKIITRKNNSKNKSAIRGILIPSYYAFYIICLLAVTINKFIYFLMSHHLRMGVSVSLIPPQLLLSNRPRNLVYFLLSMLRKLHQYLSVYHPSGQNLLLPQYGYFYLYYHS